MSELRRAAGTPEEEAALIIAQIRRYATRRPYPDPDDNAMRLMSLHHIYDAARDYLDIGMAVLNSGDEEGRLSIRVQADVLGWGSPATVDKHIRRGRSLLAEKKGNAA
jgi:hypothetical protein